MNMKRKENFQKLPKELHQLKYEAISVPQGSFHLVKKTQERKSSTCYLLITKGVTSSSPVPLKIRRVGERAANLEPVHSSPSPNHKAAFQPFQDGLFHHFDFVTKCLIATLYLHVPTTNQVVPSPPRTTTPSGCSFSTKDYYSIRYH
ncbi:uncharacterized protein TNCV_415981 [Trichonephila clavipes]|nr:uncharacterized protein TNCV_415981 [Trichonephila clavipes]